MPATRTGAAPWLEPPSTMPMTASTARTNAPPNKPTAGRPLGTSNGRVGRSTRQACARDSGPTTTESGHPRVGPSGDAPRRGVRRWRGATARLRVARFLPTESQAVARQGIRRGRRSIERGPGPDSGQTNLRRSVAAMPPPNDRVGFVGQIPGRRGAWRIVSERDEAPTDRSGLRMASRFGGAKGPPRSAPCSSGRRRPCRCRSPWPRRSDRRRCR